MGSIISNPRFFYGSFLIQRKYRVQESFEWDENDGN